MAQGCETSYEGDVWTGGDPWGAVDHFCAAGESAEGCLSIASGLRRTHLSPEPIPQLLLAQPILGSHHPRRLTRHLY